ncbi:hypothetical protein C4K33_2773 [Pseudomonas chlororaphis subsp. piscium]|nr:hypothetical protein C4K33_2773 [Pseudomonas chlororaphis subsp. piscium]AZC81957.1 hypothetical protein C4K30_2843 [Pseudomonas chlororaphis subsp. piscium]
MWRIIFSYLLGKIEVSTSRYGQNTNLGRRSIRRLFDNTITVMTGLRLDANSA